MKMVFVKPAPGGRVRMPERNSQVMPADGAFVPLNDYYQRLLHVRDVVQATAPHRQKGRRIATSHKPEPLEQSDEK